MTLRRLRLDAPSAIAAWRNAVDRSHQPSQGGRQSPAGALSAHDRKQGSKIDPALTGCLPWPKWTT
jgi:hypothetical protein